MITSIFREYDIRGIVPSELTEDTVTRIAKAFGTILRHKKCKRISLGGDVRLHTPQLKEWFIAGIASTGIDILDLGLCTTPLCYYSAYHLDIDGFVMITASHNPKEYNGFKLGIGKGTIYGQEISELKNLAIKGPFASGRGSLEKVDITDAYISMLTEKVQLQRPVTMVLDPANATGALFAREVFEKLGPSVTVQVINGEVDGSFPSHHPDPTVLENMQQLSEAVMTNRAQIGIGLDGDSDRIGVIDDKGRLISGDILTLLVAQDILREKPGEKIIFEVKSSMALEEGIHKAGGIPIMWKVGHSLLKVKMLEESAALAGEVSGHMFFADRFFGFDDAIYAACRVLEILDKSDLSLSELVDAIPQYFATPEIRLECENDEEKFRIAEEAVKHFKKTADVIDIDGARILYPDGWGLVRASNTQPTLVTRFEGKSAEARDRIQNEILSQLNTFGRLKIYKY